MQVRRQIFIALLIFSISGCNLNDDKQQPKTFYNTIGGWDITYIPIIEPYRATSLDKGVTWYKQTRSDYVLTATLMLELAVMTNWKG